MQISSPTIHDIEDFANIFEDFCQQYFSKMSMGGYSFSLSMFEPHTKCVYNGEQLNNPYNLLLKIASQGVHHFNYHSINCTCLSTTNGFLVNSVSLLNPISFDGYLGNIVWASETFNIKTINGKSYICDYILKNFY